MPTIKAVIVSAVAVSFACICQANSNQIVSPSTKADQVREQELRLEALEKSKQSVQELIKLPLSTDIEPVNTDGCFEVKTLEFSGNSIYSSDELVEVVGFSPACLDLNSINQYLKDITNHYISEGYVTSRAVLVPQDLSSGSLKLIIIEGKVEKVLFNGNPSLQLDRAMPFIVQKVLNLRDIEQGLDQINRLSRYDAQIKLLPGEEQGFSIVDIQTKNGSLGRVRPGYNNGGQKSTGQDQLSLTVTGDDVLGWLDQWNITGSKSAAWVDSKGSDSLYMSVSMPWGYWNFDYNTSLSHYKTTTLSRGFNFESKGKTNTHKFGVKWLFYRDDRSKSSFKASVHHRREKNYTLGILTEAHSRNLSSLALAWEHSMRLGPGFMTLSPILSLGTDWFGSEKNRSSDSSIPKAQFRKGSLMGSYTYPFSQKWTASSTIFAQWSNDTLYGNEQLSIGGEYSVRGFKEVSLSGEEGYYWRNDLNYRIGSFPIIGHVQSSLSLDTGTIIDDPTDDFEGGSLAGASMAVKTQGKYASTSLMLGLPISAPSRLNHDDYVIYYRLDLSL